MVKKTKQKNRKLSKEEEMEINIKLLELKLRVAILEAEIRMAKLFWGLK